MAIHSIALSAPIRRGKRTHPPTGQGLAWFRAANFGFLLLLEVSHQQYFAAAAKSQAINSRHGWKRRVFNRIEDVVNQGSSQRILFAFIKKAVKSGDVADNKRIFFLNHQPRIAFSGSALTASPSSATTALDSLLTDSSFRSKMT